MKIELKGIKHHRSLSEETNAFTGSVYIDGKRAATASNRGHGEPIDIRPLDGKRDQVRAAGDFLSKQKKIALSGDLSIQPDLDLVIGRMAERDLVRRDVHQRGKKLFGPNAMMAILHRDTSEIYTYKIAPDSGVSDAKGKAHEVVVAKDMKERRDAVCLNTLYAEDPEAAFRELARVWGVSETYDWTLESMLATGHLYPGPQPVTARRISCTRQSLGR